MYNYDYSNAKSFVRLDSSKKQGRSLRGAHGPGVAYEHCSCPECRAAFGPYAHIGAQAERKAERDAQEALRAAEAAEKVERESKRVKALVSLIKAHVAAGELKQARKLYAKLKARQAMPAPTPKRRLLLRRKGQASELREVKLSN